MNVNTLLKKKGRTGKELGQLVIASLLNDIKQAGQPDKKPLFSQAELEKMEQTISSDKDYITYGVYRDLYSGLVESYNRIQALSQQFYNGYSRLFSMLREAQDYDKAQAGYDRLPLVMTRRQYERLYKAAAEQIAGNKESFYSIIFHVLESCLEGDAPASIKAALEAAKTIPASGKSFSSSYNALMEYGYFTFKDGRRSDEMTDEELKAAFQEAYKEALGIDISLYNNAYMTLAELFYHGAGAVRELVQERTGQRLTATDEEIDKAVCSLMENKLESSLSPALLQAVMFVTPHIDEELPEGLTAYDLLEPLIDSSKYAATDRKQHLQTFRGDFPELYSALTAYIGEKLPQARGLKPSQYYKEIATWGELAESGVIGYSTQPTNISEWLDFGDTTEALQKRLRAIRGIAILDNPAPSLVDDNGDYIEPEPPFNAFNVSSLSFLAGDEETAKAIQEFSSVLIHPALGYTYAYNALLEILGNVYDIPELADVASIDTGLYESEIKTYNAFLYAFYYEVYGSEEETRRKRAIIKTLFKPLETESLKPSQEAIDAITAELTKQGFSSGARNKLNYQNTFLTRLVLSGRGEL